MQPVAVRILHPTSTNLGPLEAALYEAHARNARRLARAFKSAGAFDVRVVTEDRDSGSFGALLRTMAASPPLVGDSTGLVVLGAGTIPLARARDVRQFVQVAGSGERRALANNRYSADIVAIGQTGALADLPDLHEDNALARWLEGVAGFEIDDLRGRWRLAIDLDSPLDALLTGGELDSTIDTTSVRDRLGRIRAVSMDRRAELVIAGRTNAATLRWLERSTASRTRALVEERGFKASAPFAMSARGRPMSGDRLTLARPPRSALGLVLDDRGPEALGSVLGQLSDAAIVDSRVLLAHRLGRDEHDWPNAEDRFASDLLLVEQIRDPWLRALTGSARAAPIPVALGGHTLVGAGARLALGPQR